MIFMGCLYCNHTAYAKGLCGAHYWRWQHRRPMEVPIKGRQGLFAWKCEHTNRKNQAHGLCGSCYQKERRKDVTYKASHVQRNWASRIKIKFGLSPTEYYSMVKSQNNECKICGNSFDRQRLAIDHCHKTGSIRGLLCTRCNTHLGWFEQYSKQILEYLNPLGWFRALKSESKSSTKFQVL